jgi:GAF domain-containing protein
MDRPLYRVLVVDADQTRFSKIRDLLAQSVRIQVALDWAASYAAVSPAAPRYDALLAAHPFTQSDQPETAEALPCPPVIVITPTFHPAQADQAITAGAVDFLALDELTAPLLERAIHYAATHHRAAAAAQEERNLSEAILRVSQTLNATLDIAAVQDILLEQLAQVIPYDSACLMVVENGLARVRHLRGYHEFGPDLGQQVADLSFNIADTPNLHRLIQTGQPLVIPATTKFDGWLTVGDGAHVRSWAGAPIVVNGEVIALFSIDKTEPNFYQPRHARPLLIFATQAALALQNARLFEDETRRRREAEMLRQAAAALNLDLKLDQVLKNILERLAEVIPHDSACIFLREESMIRAVAVHGHPTPEEVLGKGYPTQDDVLFEEIKQTRQPIHLADAQTDPRFLNFGSTSYVRGWLGVPLIARGEVVGHLTIDSRSPGAYNAAHATLAQAFANQAAIAVENARLFESTQRHLAAIQAVQEASLSLTSSLDLETVLDTILENTLKLLEESYNANIFLYQNGQLTFGAARRHDRRIEKPFALPRRDGLTYTVARTGQPIVVPDMQTHPLFADSPPDWTGSILGLPLKIGPRVVGVMNVACRQPRHWPDNELHIMHLLADQAAIAIENVRLFQSERAQLHLAQTLQSVGGLLTTRMSQTEVFERIFDLLAQVVDFDSVSLQLLNAQGRLELGAARGFPSLDVAQNIVQSIGPTIQNRLVQHRVRVIPDTALDPHWIPIPGIEYIRSWIGAALIAKGKFLGTLNVDNCTPNTYHESTAETVAAFANQAAVAIENARLFEAEHAAREQAEKLREDTRQHLGLITRLYELSTEFVSTLSVEEVANLVIKKVVEATQAHSAVLNLLDAQGNFERAFGAAEPAARPTGTTRTIYKTGQPLIINNAKDEALPVQAHLRELGLRASIGLPLKAGSNIIGVLFVRYAEPHHFSQQEVETFFIFANQAAIAIDNARLYEQVQQYTAELQERIAERTFELQTLYELSQALGHASRLGDIVRLTLFHLYQVVDYDVAAILLFTEQPGKLIIQSQQPISTALENDLVQIMCGAFAQIEAADSSCDPIEIRYVQPKETTGITGPPLESLATMVQTPLLINDTPIGLMLVGKIEPTEFGKEQARLLHIAADQTAETVGRVQSLLAAEYHRLESLVAHLPNGLIVLNADLHVLLANPIGQEYLALAAPVGTGEKLDHMGGYPIELILATESTHIPVEITIVGPPDHLLALSAQSLAVGPEAGGWLLLIRNITEERFIQKRVQQQEQMAAVGQLAAGIAHDFNNILTSIIGYAELLQMGPNVPQTMQHDLGRITNQAQRAAHLVRQILDFSRQSISEKRPFDLMPFLKETIKLLERTIPENIQISLHITPSSQDYILIADLPQMQQVITNLAVNARDAMPNGGALQFTLSRLTLPPNAPPPCPNMPPGEWIAIAVSDTGVGIPSGQQTRIFEPFFTTKEIGKGTGLGLAQVYGIITQHEGYINVESTMGQGATFTIYMPYIPAPKVESRPPAPLQTPRGQGQVILIVEDNSAVLEISKAMLEHLGYRVLPAANGAGALQIYYQHKKEIGLVLTDITMPDISGIELSQVLHQENPHLKIVALTGYPLDNDQNTKNWQTHGIVDWLQKPITLEQLAQTVSRHLG